MSDGHRAVIFDLGGVVLESPLHTIARFESASGIPGGFINRVVVEAGPEGAWHRLERGELSMEKFFDAFERECRAAGHPLSARELMGAIARDATPRPSMLDALRRLRAADLLVAALTNNWASDEGRDRSLRDAFDFYFESSVLGLRKPDPAIYRHVCSEIGIEPPEAVFLDDIGANLKSARALGMTTIKVVDPEQGLRELSTVLDLELTGS